MDWVEQRAEQERKLKSGAPQFWSVFKVCCEEAVKSLNRNYKASLPHQVSFSASEYAVQVFVGDKEHRAVFEPEKYCISIGGHDYQLEVDEAGAPYAVSGNDRLTPNALCQKFLEPLFFPNSRGRSRLMPD